MSTQDTNKAETATPEHLEKILGRVRKLIERADHPNTPVEEADSARAFAEKLMQDYRIDQEHLIAVDQFSITPISKVIRLAESEKDPYYQAKCNLAYAIARHVGARIACEWVYEKANQDYAISATFVGYDSDLRYAELLLTSALLTFGAKLEPRPDKALSDQENCYRLRSAGVERNRIAAMLWGSAMDDGAAHGKVAKLYKAECAARGETAKVSGRNVNAKLYREVYAREFVWALADRLRYARDAANSGGAAPELAGREARVDEAFYTLFPRRRPAPVDPNAVPVEDKKNVKERKISKAEQERIHRLYNSPTARRARRAGEAAAREVDLSLTGVKPESRVSQNASQPAKSAIEG